MKATREPQTCHTINKNDKNDKNEKKEDIATEVASSLDLKDNSPMDLKGFMDWCKSSPQRHIQIIGEWAEVEKPSFNTKGQWKGYIQRNVRPAKNLIPYTEKQLQDAYKKLSGDFERVDSNGKRVGFITKFTLETLFKYI